MGAKDKGGRRRAGADYLKQGPATSLYCVKVMTPERSSLRLDAVLRHGAFASFSEIFAVGTNLTNQYLPFDEPTGCSRPLFTDARSFFLAGQRS